MRGCTQNKGKSRWVRSARWLELRATLGKISSLASILNTLAFSKNLLLKSFVLFSAKEEEKQKLLKWSSDLKQEREQLEQKVKQLSNSISVSKPHASLVDTARDPSTCTKVHVAPRVDSGPSA